MKHPIIPVKRRNLSSSSTCQWYNHWKEKNCKWGHVNTVHIVIKFINVYTVISHLMKNKWYHELSQGISSSNICQLVEILNHYYAHQQHSKINYRSPFITNTYCQCQPALGKNLWMIILLYIKQSMQKK